MGCAEMSRYFFTVNDGLPPDDEGIELSDLGSARIEAVGMAADLLRDRPEALAQGNDWTVSVADESGLVLFQILIVATEAPAAPATPRAHKMRVEG